MLKELSIAMCVSIMSNGLAKISLDCTSGSDLSTNEINLTIKYVKVTESIQIDKNAPQHV